MRKLCLMATVLISGHVIAQDSTINLNPVSVTASRSPQKASETGRSITVFEGRLFQQLPVRSLDELLKFVPGVEVQSRGPLGAQSDVVIRGGTFQQVLVLLDGVKVNDPITGHFSSYIPVAPNEVDRIEVLRGPAAAVYGTEAVGGVINVITKTFNQFKKEKSTQKNAGLALGEYGYFQGNAGWRTTGPKVNAAIGILSNNTFGQLLRGKNRGFNHNHTISGSIAFALKNNWSLALRSSYDGRDFAAQNFYTTFKSDTATEKVKTWWNQLQLKQQKANYSQQIDVLYKRTSDHYVFNPLATANDNKSNYFMTQYILSGKVTPAFTLTGGAQFSRRAIISNDRGNHANNQGAVFATAQYQYQSFKLVPSVRLDWDGNYGAEWLPQLNVSYQLKKVTFRAVAGRAIRGGDFTERFNNYNKPLVTGGSLGNPDLTTEKSWSYEAGVDVVLGNQFKASVTGFYRNQNNVIDFVTTPYANIPRKVNLIPTGVYALALNLKKVTTSGIEFDLAYQHQFNAQHTLYLNAGATFLHSTSSDSLPSFYIISHAKTLVQTNVLYQCKRISISANAVYKQRGELKATAINAAISKNYFLVNARVAYGFYQNKLSVFVACNNIGDIQYSDLLGSIMPRRWTTAGLNLNF